MRAFNITLSVIAALVLAGLLVYAYWLAYGLWAIALYAAMIVALPFSSLMHELGHMLAGAICKIKVIPKFKLFGNSYCEISPKGDKRLKARVYFTVKGGVIMNFLLFAVGIAGLQFGASWLGVLMPACAYLLILNDLPAEFADGKNDGMIFSDLLNETDEGRVLFAVLKAQAQLNGGKGIEELDENLLFDLPVIREDNPAFIALCELRCGYLKAKGDNGQAEKYRRRFEQLKDEYM